MHVIIAYVMVVLIWSTTPLAIQWSSGDLSFIAAVALRMSLAFALAFSVMRLLGRSLFARPDSWKVYFAASLGIFPNMPLVYWSAQFIPSGLIAVVFGLSPFISGVVSWLLYGEQLFDRRRGFAVLLALTGLGLIYQDQLDLGGNAIYGVVGIFVSCVLFAFSSVWLKRLGTGIDALSQTTGALGFSLPGLLLMWFFLDGGIPEAVDLKSLLSVGYLAVMGSVLGFTLFFYVLKHMSVNAVFLITLMSPVLALWIGVTVAGEQPSMQLLSGAGLVVMALLCYQGIGFAYCQRFLDAVAKRA